MTLVGKSAEAGVARLNGRADGRRLVYVFTTLQHKESDFYGRVGAELARRGHEVKHVTFSRRAARVLARKGFETACLPDRMAALGALDWEREAERIGREYDTPTFRDIYRTDFVCEGQPESWCIERTVRHVVAMERIIGEWRPDVIVPEVGNETMRTAAHLVGLARRIPVMFLFYTLFPDPLRLYVDTMDAPICPVEELDDVTPEEIEEVERFIAEFVARDSPIREYRRVPVTAHRLRLLARHVAVRLLYDRDNEYLRPLHWALGNVAEMVRSRTARAFYRPLGTRPYVYFPLHLMDDYKLKRVVPHCADQIQIVEQVARALPHGYDLVVKEHPMSIGRNRMRHLRRLKRMRNVRLVEPHTSTHDLIADSSAVVVISSTVGLEALLHGKPVLTLGRPFYSGFGVTRDIDGAKGVTHAVPEVLDAVPDRERVVRFLAAARRRCLPGAPVLVDWSDENAVALAGSLERSGREVAAARAERRRAAVAAVG